MRKILTNPQPVPLLMQSGMLLLLLLLLPALRSAAQDASPRTASSQAANEEAQKRKITGQVVDEQGEPLIGATVSVKGTNEKALTDLDGNYSILTAQSSPVIVVSYMGFVPQEVAAQGQSVVNVTMQENSEQLKEVIVTALGIKREKKMLGYAVQV